MLHKSRILGCFPELYEKRWRYGLWVNGKASLKVEPLSDQAWLRPCTSPLIVYTLLALNTFPNLEFA